MLVKIEVHILFSAYFFMVSGHHRLRMNPIRDSLHFNGHFPGEPGLASVHWSKGWWRWWWQLDYRSCKSCKTPVKSPPPTNQHPVFYRLDALPVAQPTVSKHWRGNITFHVLAYPNFTWGSSNYVSELPVTLGRVNCHASHQPSDASTPWPQ